MLLRLVATLLYLHSCNSALEVEIKRDGFGELFPEACLTVLMVSTTPFHILLENKDLGNEPLNVSTDLICDNKVMPLVNSLALVQTQKCAHNICFLCVGSSSCSVLLVSVKSLEQGVGDCSLNITLMPLGNSKTTPQWFQSCPFMIYDIEAWSTKERLINDNSIVVDEHVIVGPLRIHFDVTPMPSKMNLINSSHFIKPDFVKHKLSILYPIDLKTVYRMTGIWNLSDGIHRFTKEVKTYKLRGGTSKYNQLLDRTSTTLSKHKTVVVLIISLGGIIFVIILLYAL